MLLRYPWISLELIYLTKMQVQYVVKLDSDVHAYRMQSILKKTMLNTIKNKSGNVDRNWRIILQMM